MLNNDFQVLVGKYKRYKKQQKNSRMLKFLLLLLAALLGYFLFQSIQTMKPSVHATENNQTQKSPEKPTTQTDAQTNDLNQSEINSSADEMNQHRLQVTTQESSLEQLIQNQEKYKNYSSTIALANYHFSKKEYKEAIKWAITASKKNNSKARPWIVYAKSKLADGKVDIAKKALLLYLKKYKSQEAQDLLDKLNAI